MTPSSVGAISLTSLNMQIAELLAQVFTLKARIGKLPSKEPKAMEPRSPSDLSCIKLERNIAYGDRGGDLNLLELMQVAEIDFVTKAPDGKEVEELTKKEIHKALRSKISAEQAKLELTEKRGNNLRTVKFSKVSRNN